MLLSTVILRLNWSGKNFASFFSMMFFLFDLERGVFEMPEQSCCSKFLSFWLCTNQNVEFGLLL